MWMPFEHHPGYRPGAIWLAGSTRILMKEAEYAVNKRDVVHRTLSLLFFISLLVYQAMSGSGFVPLRQIGGSVFAMLLIWFPDACTAHFTTSNVAKYVRMIGWILLVGIPLWFYALSKIVN